VSLYPILWAVEHAPVRDAEERAILMALVVKGDFDGMNCFRSYPTLAKVARVDPKTAGRKCREMEQRGILRRQTEHLSEVWLRLPEAQRPVPWEVMIPASWYSRAQLAEINHQRESLGRPPITRQTRPDLAEAPPKTARSDKGKKRAKRDDQDVAPGTVSPRGPGTESPWSTGGNPGTDSPHPTDSESLAQGLIVPQPSKTPSEIPSELAPSARSAADVRRTGAGSSARAHGGFAATSKTLRLTSEQRAALRVVEGALPRPLLAQLPGQRIPGNNYRAVLAALDARTPEQIAGRIGRRWVGWGFEPAFHDGQIRNPIGAAMALIGPTPYCPDPSCEDGVMVDTGDECRACVERRAHRRAAYNRGEDPRRTGGASAPRPECVDCGRPLVADVPDDGMCRRCHQTPAEAVAVLMARWAAEDAARAETEALYAEAARRREQRAANSQTTQSDGPPPF
jgi:DNA-binding Lrp family transcriptional regulator